MFFLGAWEGVFFMNPFPSEICNLTGLPSMHDPFDFALDVFDSSAIREPEKYFDERGGGRGCNPTGSLTGLASGSWYWVVQPTNKQTRWHGVPQPRRRATSCLSVVNKLWTANHSFIDHQLNLVGWVETGIKCFLGLTLKNSWRYKYLFDLIDLGRNNILLVISNRSSLRYDAPLQTQQLVTFLVFT